MTQRAALRCFPGTSSTEYGSTSSSSRRGAFAIVAGFRMACPRRTASLRAARRVRCTWWAVAGGAAGLLHLLVEALQVFRLQLLQAVGAQAGDEVVVHRDAVAVDGVLGDIRRCNVLDPVGEPGLDRPALVSLAYRTLVALPLQLPDGFGDLRAGLAADVAPVWRAVVLDADGDAAVPATVLAEVDG